MVYLKYFCGGLTPELIKKAELELGETEEVRLKSLDELRKLIQGEPDFHPRMDDVFLLRFLRSQKFNIEKSFKKLKKYYTHKAQYSSHITDILPCKIKEQIEHNQTAILEFRDPNFVGLYVSRVGQYNDKKFTVEKSLAHNFMMADIGLEEEATQIAGYTVILDFADFGLEAASRYARPTALYRYITAITGIIPCRIKAYHIVNESFLFSIILKFCNPFLTEKFKNRIYCHGSNLESLHKFVPKDILPEELGGKQGPMSKYGKEFSKILLGKEEYFIHMKEFGYKNKVLEQLKRK